MRRTSRASHTVKPRAVAVQPVNDARVSGRGVAHALQLEAKRDDRLGAVIDSKGTGDEHPTGMTRPPRQTPRVGVQMHKARVRYRVVSGLGPVVSKPRPVARLHQIDQRGVAEARVHIVELVRREPLVLGAVARVHQNVVRAATRHKSRAVGAAAARVTTACPCRRGAVASAYAHPAQPRVQRSQVPTQLSRLRRRLRAVFRWPVAVLESVGGHEEEVGGLGVVREAPVVGGALQQQPTQAELRTGRRAPRRAGQSGRACVDV